VFKEIQMDHFGIGNAVRASALSYFQGASRSGRTTSLIESVKDGDRILFKNQREANRVSSLLRDRNPSLQVQCIVLDPKESSRIFELGSLPGEGRTLFDHGWVEQYYLDAINNAIKSIDSLQRETSRYGEAHRETKRKIEAFRPWFL